MWSLVVPLELNLSPGLQISLLVGLAAALFAAGFSILLGVRRSPAELERLRRLAVNRDGRLCGANIVDWQDHLLHYTYEVSGVVYETSQDVSALIGDLPQAIDQVIGSGWAKYLADNPANSIVLCETWSGLRVRR